MVQIMVCLGECFMCTGKECVSSYYYVNCSINVNKYQLGKWVDNLDLAFYILINFLCVLYVTEIEMLMSSI